MDGWTHRWMTDRCDGSFVPSVRFVATSDHQSGDCRFLSFHWLLLFHSLLLSLSLYPAYRSYCVLWSASAITWLSAHETNDPIWRVTSSHYDVMFAHYRDPLQLNRLARPLARVLSSNGSWTQVIVSSGQSISSNLRLVDGLSIVRIIIL